MHFIAIIIIHLFLVSSYRRAGPACLFSYSITAQKPTSYKIHKIPKIRWHFKALSNKNPRSTRNEEEKRKRTLTCTQIQLSKYPLLNNLERQTSVPKVYAVLGVVGVYFFLVFFNIAGEFLVNFAGFLIPGYYSLHALFTAGTADDTQVSIFFFF